MKLYWLLLFISLTPAQAEIYRWVDADGNVVYSDEAHPDAETIDLPQSTTYTPVEEAEPEPEVLKLSPEAELTEPGEMVLPAYQLRIIAPANDESIWVNNGDVSISMVLEPGLNTERGDQIILLLNGSQVAGPQASTTFQLNNVSRGTHTVAAAVVDNTGTVITRSASVTFHLHRTSILNKQQNNPAS